MIRSGNYGGILLTKASTQNALFRKKDRTSPMQATSSMHRQQVTEATKHFFGLESQGVMAKLVTEAVTKKTITLWSKTVNELTASSFKFVRKAFQQLLPTAANLVRWKRITDPVCHLCNNGQWQTNKHVLSNCNSTTALTRYTRRHNLVLEKITEWILETK